MRPVLIAAMAACGLSGCAGGFGMDTLPGEYRTAERMVDPHKKGLAPAPAGYAWYSYGGEYVLAARLSGRVKSSVPGS